MKRQVFFVQVGGYDLHTGQTGNAGNATVDNSKVIIGAQANLFAELSQSMNAFQNAMIKIGAQYSDPAFEQRVTAFTVERLRTHPSQQHAGERPRLGQPPPRHGRGRPGAAHVRQPSRRSSSEGRTIPAPAAGSPRQPSISSRRRWQSGSASIAQISARSFQISAGSPSPTSASWVSPGRLDPQPAPTHFVKRRE